MQEPTDRSSCPIDSTSIAPRLAIPTNDMDLASRVRLRTVRKSSFPSASSMQSATRMMAAVTSLYWKTLRTIDGTDQADEGSSVTAAGDVAATVASAPPLPEETLLACL